MKLSVVIPAHNEEGYIGGCLAAAREAERVLGDDVEIVVVLNRCTDRTRTLAEAARAVCVIDETRCLSAIRNRGVAAASGDVIVTCDADSRLHPQMLFAVRERLEAGAVGGGVDVKHDRRSLGIATTELLLRLSVRLTGVSCGAFSGRKADVIACGGFDEHLPMGEDLDFGKRLRALGKGRGQPYLTLWETPVTTSSRKFDRFGDWAFFKMMLLDGMRIRRSLKGRDTEFVDEYFYDFNDNGDA